MHDFKGNRPAVTMRIELLYLKSDCTFGSIQIYNLYTLSVCRPTLHNIKQIAQLPVSEFELILKPIQN